MSKTIRTKTYHNNLD